MSNAKLRSCPFCGCEEKNHCGDTHKERAEISDHMLSLRSKNRTKKNGRRGNSSLGTSMSYRTGRKKRRDGQWMRDWLLYWPCSAAWMGGAGSMKSNWQKPELRGTSYAEISECGCC